MSLLLIDDCAFFDRTDKDNAVLTAEVADLQATAENATKLQVYFLLFFKIREFCFCKLRTDFLLPSLLPPLLCELFVQYNLLVQLVTLTFWAHTVLNE